MIPLRQPEAWEQAGRRPMAARDTYTRCHQGLDATAQGFTHEHLYLGRNKGVSLGGGVYIRHWKV